MSTKFNDVFGELYKSIRKPRIKPQITIKNKKDKEIEKDKKLGRKNWMCDESTSINKVK